MLESLHIKNFALVSELELDFAAGLNTVSGETGAGKSLILGAVQLLAGSRASQNSIRKGSSLAELSGVFNLAALHPPLLAELSALLEQAALPPCEEGRLLIRRIISENGSRAFVNSSAVTVTLLRQLGELLVDIHGPNDNHSLLDPHKQLELLDSYAKNDEALLLSRRLWRQLEDCSAALQELDKINLHPEEAQLLEFQIREIEEAELREDEEEEIVARHRLAAHAKSLLELASEAAGSISEEENCLCEQVAAVVRTLQDIARIDPARGAQFIEQIENIATMLNDLGMELQDYAAGVEINEEELRRLELRLELIQRMKRKYGGNIAAVLASAERIKQRLQSAKSKADELQNLLAQQENLRRQHEKACLDLRQKRQAAASGMAGGIASKLADLGFDKAAFELRLDECKPGALGADRLEFCFAPNIGEEMQPLRQIGSSGEVARVMLAIKTVLCHEDKVPVLIFDEIDANVGGRIAAAVAKELQKVSQKHQVFCITHLPRIAAAGEKHYMVSKFVEQQRTRAEMKLLEQHERVSELVRMLGAQKDSESAEKHAREMLQEAGKTGV